MLAKCIICFCTAQPGEGQRVEEAKVRNPNRSHGIILTTPFVYMPNFTGILKFICTFI
jgi:hypothetical protein